MIDEKDLVDGFKKLGLDKGNFVLVHSSFKSLGEVSGGPQVVIDALLKCIGKNGTLLMPTFNFDFSNKGISFDVRNIPSQMGIITELVRKNPKSKRTMDPIYSFSILGKLSDFLGGIQYENSYDKDSMFAKLRELNGKIMIIGLKYNNSMTFFHHVEEMQHVDYRKNKQFSGLVTNHNGVTSEDSITLYVRDLERGVITEVERMGKILENEGFVQVRKIGNSTVKLMKANDVYQRTIQEMKKNPYILCKFEPPGKNM